MRGRLFLADRVRPDAADCIGLLQGMGIDCVLLSGDRRETAAALAAAVGIGTVQAPRSPQEKLAAVRERAAAGRVAMVGDGVNDAPALAAAHVGIAVGGGMELARVAGNVVLLGPELVRIPWLVSLARKSAGIIRGNFAWSFAYNAVALAAAAAGVLPPLLAALAMVFSSLTVLGNSLRLASFPEPAATVTPPGEGPPPGD